MKSRDLYEFLTHLIFEDHSLLFTDLMLELQNFRQDENLKIFSLEDIQLRIASIEREEDFLKGRIDRHHKPRVSDNNDELLSLANSRTMYRPKFGSISRISNGNESSFMGTLKNGAEFRSKIFEDDEGSEVRQIDPADLDLDDFAVDTPLKFTENSEDAREERLANLFPDIDSLPKVKLPSRPAPLSEHRSIIEQTEPKFFDIENLGKVKGVLASHSPASESPLVKFDPSKRVLTKKYLPNFSDPSNLMAGNEIPVTYQLLNDVQQVVRNHHFEDNFMIAEEDEEMEEDQSRATEKMVMFDDRNLEDVNAEPQAEVKLHKNPLNSTFVSNNIIEKPRNSKIERNKVPQHSNKSFGIFSEAKSSPQTTKQNLQELQEIVYREDVKHSPSKKTDATLINNIPQSEIMVYQSPSKPGFQGAEISSFSPPVNLLEMLNMQGVEGGSGIPFPKEKNRTSESSLLTVYKSRKELIEYLDSKYKLSEVFEDNH